jgi:hypothetical protein
VLLVNVPIADLQNLRDKAEEATRKWPTVAGPSKHRMVELNEAVYFSFENPAAAAVFQAYCVRNQIPNRRIGDGNWMRAP